MRIRYVGDGDESPRVTTVFGHRFVLDGDAVEVEGDAAAKLSANPTFEVVTDDPAVAEDDAALLRAALEDAGIEVDGRWGVKRMAEELARATDG